MGAMLLHTILSVRIEQAAISVYDYSGYDHNPGDYTSSVFNWETLSSLREHTVNTFHLNPMCC